MWWRDTSFLDKMRECWSEADRFLVSPSYCFVRRMQFLKHGIKIWNKESFKNSFFEKLRLEEELELLNSRVMPVGMTNLEYVLEKRLKEQYLEVLNKEELYWKDKFRELWIVEGHSNTNFFHASIKVKRSLNNISSIKNDGDRWCVSSEDIEQATVENFVGVLGKDASLDFVNFPLVEDSIANLVSMEDNNLLLAPYSIEEVREATFSLHPYKAPNLNGIMT